MKKSVAVLSVALGTALYASLQASATVVDFGSGPSNFVNKSGTTLTLGDASILLSNVGYFSGGPDHTIGDTNGYNAYAFSGDKGLQTYVFNKPVAIASLWLTEYYGTPSANATSPLTVRAYGSMTASPSSLLGTYVVNPIPHAGNGVNYGPTWQSFTSLASQGAVIQRLEFSSATGNVQVDDINYTPAAATTPVKLMLLGDSITQGINPCAGYRYALAQNLNIGQVNYQYVGSRTITSENNNPTLANYPLYNAANDTFFDKHHEGYGAMLTNLYSSVYGDQTTNITNSLNSNRPDVVVLQLGTNDVGQNNTANSMANLTSVIGRIRAANANAKIILAQVPGFTASGKPNAFASYAPYAGNVAAFNTQVAALGASLNSAQSPIQVVDQYTNFDSIALTFDGLHPNIYGEQLLADRYFVAYQKIANPAAPLRSPDFHLGNAGFDDVVLSDGNVASGSSATAQGQVNNGWSYKITPGTSDAGVWNPGSNSYTGAAGSGTPTGGNGAQAGFIYNNTAVASPSQAAAVSQQLGSILTPWTQYTLTAAIGTRLTTSPYAGTGFGGYLMELLAGDTVIGAQTNAVTPTAGQFLDTFFTVDSRLLAESLQGQELRVRFSMPSLASGKYVDFDNVRLTAMAIPEPASLLLMGLGAGVLMLRRASRKN